MSVGGRMTIATATSDGKLLTQDEALLTPIGPPLPVPPCPRADAEPGCAGVMRPGTGHTMLVRATGQALERLRCDVCRESGWYLKVDAYAPLSSEVAF